MKNLTILVAALLAGCGSPVVLNPGAEVVDIRQEFPNPAPKKLGEVSCDRGMNARGPAENVKRCRIDLKNQAHALGGDLVVLETQQVGTGECTNCVVMFGTAYKR